VAANLVGVHERGDGKASCGRYVDSLRPRTALLVLSLAVKPDDV